MSKVVCTLSLSMELVEELDKRTYPQKGIKRSAVAEAILWHAIESNSPDKEAAAPVVQVQGQDVDIDTIVQRVLSILGASASRPLSEEKAEGGSRILQGAG